MGDVAPDLERVDCDSEIAYCLLTDRRLTLATSAVSRFRLLMADERQTRLNPLRHLAETTDDIGVLDLVIATVTIIEKDTALVLDQTHIARDVAARTKAGDWFGNTELTEIMSDADYFVRVYKQQREEIGQLQAMLRDKRSRLCTPDDTKGPGPE